MSTPRLGRYEILARIGRGGTATVYLARAKADPYSRLLAVKLLHNHAVSRSDDGVRLILREAEVASRLQHINIVPLLEVGIHDGAPFLVMDYVEGCSLSALLSVSSVLRGPRLIVPIVLDALSGLEAVHALTDEFGDRVYLVHRDIAPGNLLVGVDGACRLTDFGIARWSSQDSLTETGFIRGTPGYMAPEQVAGGPVDARADIFAVGVILWSALTGRALFKGENIPATLFNVLQRRVPPPSKVGLRPPSCFDSICLKALGRNPDQRFTSALEMADALRGVAVQEGYLGSPAEVAKWISEVFGGQLAARRRAVADLKRTMEGGLSLEDDGLVSTSDLLSIPPIYAEPVSEPMPTLDELRESTRRERATSYPSITMGMARGLPARRSRFAAVVGLCLVLAGATLFFTVASTRVGAPPDPKAAVRSEARPEPGFETPSTAVVEVAAPQPQPPVELEQGMAAREGEARRVAEAESRFREEPAEERQGRTRRRKAAPARVERASPKRSGQETSAGRSARVGDDKSPGQRSTKNDGGPEEKAPSSEPSTVDEEPASGGSVLERNPYLQGGGEP